MSGFTNVTAVHAVPFPENDSVGSGGVSHRASDLMCRKLGKFRCERGCGRSVHKSFVQRTGDLWRMRRVVTRICIALVVLVFGMRRRAVVQAICRRSMCVIIAIPGARALIGRVGWLARLIRG